MDEETLSRPVLYCCEALPFVLQSSVVIILYSLHSSQLP